MTPEKPELEIGRAYFLCGYYIRDLPIPQIETWIYVGSNIHDDDEEEDEIFHYFEDPAEYFEECVRDELIDLEMSPDEAEATGGEKLRVADSCLEAHIYDYEGLSKWINSLAKEPDADKAF